MSHIEGFRDKYIKGCEDRASQAMEKASGLLRSDQLDEARLEFEKAIKGRQLVPQVQDLLNEFLPEANRFFRALDRLNQGLVEIGSKPVALRDLEDDTQVGISKLPTIATKEGLTFQPTESKEAIRGGNRKSKEAYRVEFSDGRFIENHAKQVMAYLEIIKGTTEEQPMPIYEIEKDLEKKLGDRPQTSIYAMRTNAIPYLRKVGLYIEKTEITNPEGGKPIKAHYLTHKLPQLPIPEAGEKKQTGFTPSGNSSSKG